MKFVIESAFICDDVRREANGKLIFIGAYSHAMIVREFPATLRPNVVLCVRIETPGKYVLETDVSLDDEKQVSGELGFEVNTVGFNFVHFPVPLIKAESAKTLIVQTRVPNGKWNETLKVQIQQGNVPQMHSAMDSSESEPLS